MAMKHRHSQKHKARILIVEDHPIVRYGIARILTQEEDLAVCGEAGDGQEALQLLEKAKPDLVLLDISLKRIDGLKLLRIIRTDYPSLPVVILSMHDESVYGPKALRLGARGYIMKEESSEKLVAGVREVLRGEIYASDRVKKQVLSRFVDGVPGKTASPVDILSDRERQIFLMLGQGLTSRAIAEKLMVSVKTVETHRARIKVKLDIEHSNQLIVAAADWAERESLRPATT